jgi:hypothetical protein
MTWFSHFIAAWALLCAVQVSGVGQETLPTTGQSLEGTWIAQVAQPGGDFAPFGLGTFSPNGSYRAQRATRRNQIITAFGFE